MSETAEGGLDALDDDLPAPCCQFCGRRFDPDAPAEKRVCPARDAGVCRP